MGASCTSTQTFKNLKFLMDWFLWRIVCHKQTYADHQQNLQLNVQHLYWYIQLYIVYIALIMPHVGKLARCQAP